MKNAPNPIIEPVGAPKHENFRVRIGENGMILVDEDGFTIQVDEKAEVSHVKSHSPVAKQAADVGSEKGGGVLRGGVEGKAAPKEAGGGAVAVKPEAAKPAAEAVAVADKPVVAPVADGAKKPITMMKQKPAAAVQAQPEPLALASLTAADITAQKKAEADRAEQKRVQEEKDNYIRDRQAKQLDGSGAAGMDQAGLAGIETDTPLFNQTAPAIATKPSATAQEAIEVAKQSERVDTKPAQRTLTPELARRLLSLPSQMRTKPYGDGMRRLRQDVLEALTGERPPIAKAGVTAVNNALANEAGVTEADSYFDRDKKIEAFLNEVAGVKPAPDSDIVDINDVIARDNAQVGSELEKLGWKRDGEALAYSKTFDRPATGGMMNATRSQVSLTFRGDMPVVEVGWDSILVPTGKTATETAKLADDKAKQAAPDTASDTRLRQSDSRLTNRTGNATITYQQGQDSNATDTQNRQVRAQRIPRGVDQASEKDYGRVYADFLRSGLSEHEDWYDEGRDGAN